MTDSVPIPLPDQVELDVTEHGREPLPLLALGAIGVVFGDIGTSPLYALKESFAGHHPLPLDRLHIFGVLSLIFWTMMLIVTVKYVLIILRADNKGEGGSLALLALISRSLGERKWVGGMVMLGVAATALFYGDAIITPAISVLSAVEGLEVVNQGFDRFVLPISILILIGLFAIQSYGTARVGALFGPVMIFYFLILAVLGATTVIHHPHILQIVNPLWAVRFFLADPKLAFLALGSVVLAVTGAEALYADMGHFGRRAISISWLYIALPCLLLNYMGQGALLLDNPKAIENPFFLLAPDWARLPLVILATMATVIASQAVISGAFSVTQQAVQLGFLPRLRIVNTSAKAAGQIYVPLINWGLLLLVIGITLGFKSSANLAAAYGIAVTGTMLITAVMLGVLTFTVWKWPPILAALVTGSFILIDAAYFASNLTKVLDGGWFPLLIAAIAFTLLTTWATGRRIMRDRLGDSGLTMEMFLKSTAKSLDRVPGTAVFLSTSTTAVPPALLHNVKHNKVLHHRIVVLTVKIQGVPHVPAERRIETSIIAENAFRIILHYGFMEEVDIPRALDMVEGCAGAFRQMDTSYFLGRQTLIPSANPAMPIWREQLFAWMVQNAESAMEFFKLPVNRVVELGSQLEI
jgi:KUP system potassium uptake protein